MPELPEVEHLRRTLLPHLVGAVVGETVLHRADVLRSVAPSRGARETQSLDKLLGDPRGSWRLPGGEAPGLHLGAADESPVSDCCGEPQPLPQKPPADDIYIYPEVVSMAQAKRAPAAWPASVPTLPIAVVGAHLSGLPLNGQLTERGATLREATHTAPHYRLFALPNTTPPKPGLLRASAYEAGAAIAVEVWDMPLDAVGSFLALIPAPLGLGSLELADGRWVHGFVCEAHALTAARDVTAFGGWRAFMQAGAPP